MWYVINYVMLSLLVCVSPVGGADPDHPAVTLSRKSTAFLLASESLEQIHLLGFILLVMVRRQQCIIPSVVVVPVCLSAAGVANAKLYAMLRWHASWNFNDERERVGVSASADVIHESALDISVAFPRIEGDPNFDGFLE